jgi:nucleoside-diphosphate-sugar epimerase
MKVLVTGSTGYLGLAIAARLVKSGNEVLGLARRPERAEALRSFGVKPVLGDIAEPESYLAELKNCDAVVQAAEFEGDAARGDQLVLEAIRGAVLDGRVRRVLYTSGVWVHGDTGDAIEDEAAELEPAERVAWRPAHEDAALDLVEHEARVAVMRPGMVYGGAGGTLGDWFREARDGHTVSYPGDGSQHWTMVHRDDVAEAYRLALEHAQGGQRFLLVDESRFTVRELAEAVARATGAEARPVEREQVLEREGTLGAAYLMDQRMTAAKARRELGWVPRHTSFVAEVEDLHREWVAGEKAAVA